MIRKVDLSYFRHFNLLEQQIGFHFLPIFRRSPCKAAKSLHGLLNIESSSLEAASSIQSLIHSYHLTAVYQEQELPAPT